MRFATLCRATVLTLLVPVSAAAQTPVQKVTMRPASALASLAWTSLATDPKGDVLLPRLPDARELSYAIDDKGDRVWFKVSVYDPLPERWFGINVALDIDGTPDNGMAWWGTNKIKFDHVASVYLSRTDEDWQGYVGYADADSLSKGDMGNRSRALEVSIDREQRAIAIGIPRSAIGAATTARIIATVGSMTANNDDVPNEGMITITLRP
jgi:hypothetical protein